MITPAEVEKLGRGRRTGQLEVRYTLAAADDMLSGSAEVAVTTAMAESPRAAGLQCGEKR
jgi:hypothetical protein